MTHLYNYVWIIIGSIKTSYLRLHCSMDLAPVPFVILWSPHGVQALVPDVDLYVSCGQSSHELPSVNFCCPAGHTPVSP